MRQPRKSRARYIEEDGGIVNELDPIEIEGSVSRANDNVIDLEPIDIVGDPNADVEPFRPEEGTVRMGEPGAWRYEPGMGERGGTNVLPDAVVGSIAQVLPQWALDRATGVDDATPADAVSEFGGLLGRLVDQDDGTTGYEAPEVVADIFAGNDGRAATGVIDGLMNLASHGAGSAAPQIARMARTGSPRMAADDRTLDPNSMMQGAVDTGSFSLGDDIVGLFDEDRAEAMRSNQRWAERENPGSTSLGGLLGSVPSMALPAASAGRGATAMRGAGLAAAEGGGFGLLEGVGRSDADTIGGRLRDAAPGAALGAVMGGTMGGLARRAQLRSQQPVDTAAIEDALNRAAWQRLSQAGAHQSLSSAKQRLLAPGTTERARTESARRTVERMREIGAFDTRMGLPPGPDVIADRVRNAQTAAYNSMDEIGERMAGEVVDAEPLLRHVRERVSALDAIPGAETQAEQMRRNLQRFEERVTNNDLSMSDLQRWKTFWRENINFDAPQQREAQGVYRAITENMQQGVDNVDPALGRQYQQARQDAFIGQSFDELNGSNARNDARLRQFSLTDYLTGLQGFQQGGVLGGTASVIANRGLRRNEHALAARSLERAAERLRTAPERFGRHARVLQAAQQRGPRAFAAALYLSAQQDEHVRRAMSEEEQRESAQQMNADADAFFTDDDLPGDVPPPSEEEMAEFFQ